MVTRTDRAIVMGWRSSNILHDSMFEKSGLSSVHFRWLLCESRREKVRGKGESGMEVAVQRTRNTLLHILNDAHLVKS